MKVMAIAVPQVALTPDVLKPYMSDEVPHTLQLYLDGKVEQFWFVEKSGPIFLMNVESIDQAKATINTLPLVTAGLMAYDLKPVGPLIPLGRLIPQA
ncbi:hypothetical protein [Dyella nitratireducens]|uniref:Muconolactone isomerase domain-containing protein n=1 Tax=Dyella nitratireducens TaxID=1849580 RepID=A0ABQ1FUP5_9GAMM|nr:hypothetical protein [Dyella nitratireducens]GGA29416.1 hypothetical protein GCM10010981_17930 [Dyella nitratireducens]GLQ43142.1 hypothetical protein GCM10007902_29920 [Dyella nitratireducens]